MGIVKITFNKNKDIYNIWDACNSKNTFGFDFKKKINKKILKLCKDKKFEKVKEKLEEHYSNIYNSNLMRIVVESFIRAWNKIEKRYFKKLEKITGKKFPVKKVMAFVTTTSRCPYNPNPDNAYFFVNFFVGIPNAMKTCGHELMHIHFHNTYWNKVAKEIGKEKTADLKEALTVLLNLEFREMFIVKDEGYPNHKELRKFIEKKWKENPNFDILIDKCIGYLKK